MFALTLSATARSQFLGRLCKPYDPADLSIDTAKDKHGAARDCDDLPAQISPALREVASDFCRRRDWLQERINAVGRHTQPAGPVANAHLIQALDDTLQELAQRPGRQRLHVLSDMLQHAASYSHLDLPWSAWRFEDLLPSRPVHGRPLHRASAQQPTRVNVLYLPRSGLTDARRTKQAHQAFWREYFAGAEVTFSEQSPQPGFEAVPLMQTPKAAESAVRERKLLQSQRRESEDQLAQVARETEAIESQRQEGVRLAQQRHAPKAEPLDMAAGVEIAAGGKNAPEAGGEGAPGRFSVESASQAACLLTLRPHFSGQIAPGRHPDNNRRANYGDATITVSYLVDTQGATVDDDVLVLTGRSVAEKSEYFDIPSEDTLRVVKGWAFTLQRRGTDGMCITPQRRTVTFAFAGSASDDGCHRAIRCNPRSTSSTQRPCS